MHAHGINLRTLPDLVQYILRLNSGDALPDADLPKQPQPRTSEQ